MKTRKDNCKLYCDMCHNDFTIVTGKFNNVYIGGISWNIELNIRKTTDFKIKDKYRDLCPSCISLVLFKAYLETLSVIAYK